MEGLFIGFNNMRQYKIKVNNETREMSYDKKDALLLAEHLAIEEDSVIVTNMKNEVLWKSVIKKEPRRAPQV